MNRSDVLGASGPLARRSSAREQEPAYQQSVPRQEAPIF